LQLDVAALKLIFESVDDSTFKMSAGEKAWMVTTYRLPNRAGDECFLKWFKDILGSI